MPRKGFAGAAVVTTITSSIASSGTGTFTIASATGWTFSATPFVVVVDRGLAAEEKILCSGIAGTTITMQTRGYDGTTQAAHSSSAQCIHVYDSVEAESSNAHVFDTSRNDHTQYARLSGATFVGGIIGTTAAFTGLTTNTSGVQIGRAASTLSNGANNNVAVSASATYMTYTGPTGAYSVTGFASAADGRVLIVYFNIAQTLTLAHDSASSSAGQRITLPGQADLTFAPNKLVRCVFVYDQSVGGGVGYWVLFSATDGSSYLVDGNNVMDWMAVSA